MDKTSQSVSPEAVRRIEQVCDRFETACKAGQRPRIEDYLTETPERDALLRELIRLEIAYCRRQGNLTQPEDYCQRFPGITPEWLANQVPVGEVGPSPAAAWSLAGYEILEELGRGGMGVVYKARHLGLDRVVALKMVLSGSHASTGELHRFRAEAEAIARLQHPHIVQIFETGEHDGKPFLALEFCPGGSLDKKLGGNPLPPAEAARLTALLAGAVQAAHNKSVVHRDLKPSNVLLAEDGVPKITDFGLAKKLDAAAQTVSGAIVGTPSYMAPEQASGKSKEIGPAADVYALGAILYELLTGRPPFKAATVLDTLRQVLTQEPVSPRQLNAQVPHDLETICLKALAKEPLRRYPSAADLAADLERFLNNQPIQARPPSALYRVRKFTARNRALVGSTLAIFLILVVGIIAIAVAWLHENTALSEARVARREREAELIRTHGVAARLAAQKGEWSEALRHYDAALAGEPEDATALRLGKLETRLALYQYKEFRDELAELAAHPNLGEHAGTVRLLRGYERLLSLRTEETDPLLLLREALTMELPPAERAYAEALLAPTVPEAIKHLQKAVEADPFHRRAYEVLPMLLFLTGRLPEARDAASRLRGLAPHSISSQGYPILLHVLDGDLEKALRECAKVRPMLGEDGEEAFRFLARLFHTTRSPEFQWETNLPIPLLLEFTSMAPRVIRLMKAGSGPEGQENWGQFAVFRLPAFQDLGSAGVLQDVLRSPAKLFTISSSEFADAMGKITQRIPNGFFFYERGVLLHRAKRLAESEEVLRTALRTPSLFDIERRALFELLCVQMERSRQLTEADRKKLHDEARQELYRLAHWGTYPPWALKEMFWIATKLQEHTLALELSETWLRQVPGDRSALEARLDAEFEVGAHGRAVKTARELLAKGVARDDMLNQQAVAEFARGNYGQALSLVLEAQRANPKNKDLDVNFKELEQRLQLVQARTPILLAKVRLRQALVEARSGNHAGAVAAARAAVPDKEPDGDMRIALACVHALASAAASQDMNLPANERDQEAERRAAEALAHLEAAHAAGYFKQPARVEYLTSESDLASLRKRPEFKQFLARTGNR